MAFQKFTQCENVGDYDAADYANKLLFTDIGFLRKFFGAIALLAIGTAFPPAALVTVLLLIIAYCNWWLYKRLICLGGDRCAIGLLASVEPATEKTGFDAIDTDYSINLILAPNALSSNENDGIQGDLIKQTATTGDARVGPIKEFPFKGLTVKVGEFGDPVVLDGKVLHCEFEGGGVQKLKEAAEAALPFALAAAAACAIPIPIITFICLVLAAIATVITLAGLGSALTDRGSPTDVNPKLNELHPYSDVLFVKGEWVFDSAHEGWNEIHPIKQCQRIGTWQGSWDFPDQWADLFEVWSMSSRPPDLPTPPAPVPPALPTAFLTIKPDNVVGGKPAKGTIVFAAPPSAGGKILLTSSDPAVVVPAFVTTVKNQVLYHFDLTTKAVSSRLTVKIAATFDGLSQAVSMIVRPVPTPEDWKKLIGEWCDMVSDTTSSLTVANQARPENQWAIHPLIDGCQSQEPSPPAPPPIH